MSDSIETLLSQAAERALEKLHVFRAVYSEVEQIVRTVKNHQASYPVERTAEATSVFEAIGRADTAELSRLLEGLRAFKQGLRANR